MKTRWTGIPELRAQSLELRGGRERIAGKLGKGRILNSKNEAVSALSQNFNAK